MTAPPPIGAPDFGQIAPEVLLLLWGGAILMATPLTRRYPHPNRLFPVMAVAGLTLAIICLAGQVVSYWALGSPPGVFPAFADRYSLDGLTLFGKGLILVVGLASALARRPTWGEDHPGPPLAGLLIGLAGMMAMTGGMDLIVLWLGAEVAAVGNRLYRNRPDLSGEGATGRVWRRIRGGLSVSATPLCLTLVHHIAESTRLSDIQVALATGSAPTPLISALLLTLVAIGWRLAAILSAADRPSPHARGALPPTPWAGLLTVAPLTALTAVALRYSLFLPPRDPDPLPPALALAALAALGWSTAIAWRSRSLADLATRAALTQAGFVALALLGRDGGSPGRVGVMLIASLFMALGGWATHDLAMGRTPGIRPRLARAIPRLAGITLLAALAGLPPTLGFPARWEVFRTVLEAWRETGGILMPALVVAATVNSLVLIAGCIGAVVRRPDPGPGTYGRMAWVLGAVVLAALVLPGLWPSLLTAPAGLAGSLIPRVGGP